MDVEYTLDITNKYFADADMVTKIGGVNISPIQQERQDDFTVHTDDGGAIVSPGKIRRTITATLTAEFESKFPTEDQRRTALNGAFEEFFTKNVPAIVKENISFI